MKTLAEKIKAKRAGLDRAQEYNEYIDGETNGYNIGLEDAIRIVENHTCECKHSKHQEPGPFCQHCGGRIVE